MFKAKNNLSPIMMKEIFPDRNDSGPHLRSQVDIEVPPVEVSITAKRHGF